MNLRVYFPEEFDCQFNDGYPLGLRLECFNSVDGTSRLVILLGWLRFVCSNGLVIGETMVEVRSVHNARLSLGDIPHIIREGLKAVSKDKDRMKAWENTPVDKSHIIPWVDKEVATTWNAKAASRTLHIVTTHTILESFAHAC